MTATAAAVSMAPAASARALSSPSAAAVSAGESANRGESSSRVTSARGRGRRSREHAIEVGRQPESREPLAHPLGRIADRLPPQSAATCRRDRRDRRADAAGRTRGSAAAPAAATRRRRGRPGRGAEGSAPAAAAAAAFRAACAARRDSAPPDEGVVLAWSGGSTTARHSLRGTGARIATAVESSASPGSVRSIGGSASASSSSAGSSSSGTIEKSVSISAGKVALREVRGIDRAGWQRPAEGSAEKREAAGNARVPATRTTSARCA